MNWQVDIIIALFSLCLNHVCPNNLYTQCEFEASWGPWRCPGEEERCTEQYATRYRCIGGNCTVDSFCSGLPGFQENKTCKFILQQGLCVPWWASWSPWSKCTATCGFTERSRYRACIGAVAVKYASEETEKDIHASCMINARAHEGVESKDCPVRRLCPNVNGAWGDWGTFSPCSATCGFGTRSRVRKCNRPAPQGNGLYCQGIDTQNIPCEGPVPCPQKGQWCPWSNVIKHCSHPCGPLGMGLRTRQCSCPKPSYGGENCEVPPEAAIHADYEESKRNVGADVPLPSSSAIEAIRTGQGRWEPCNRHHCPYLKYLKLEEEAYVIEDLMIQKAEDAWEWSAGQPAGYGEPVQLRCPPSRHSRINVFDKPGRFPKSQAYWTRAMPPSASTLPDVPGDPITNSKLILVEGDRLTIRSLEPEAVGVYRYGYEYEPGYFETVCFFIVYNKASTWNIPYGSTFDLTCNARGLWPVLQKVGLGNWYVYWSVQLKKEAGDFDTEQRWWYTELMKQHSRDEVAQMNETLSYVDHKFDQGTGLTLWDTEYRRIYRATPAMNGRYTCTIFNVINATYNRTFVTDSFELIVSSPPTVGELVSKWCLNNKWNLVALLLTGLVTTVISGFCLWRRAQNIARLEVFTKEAKRARRNINLADLDARVD